MVFSINRAVLLLLPFGLGQALALGQAEETKAGTSDQAEFIRDIQPLLKRYCYGCHGNKRAKAELNLEEFGTTPNFFKDGRTWEQVHHMLYQREMPPEKKLQPTEDERILL